MSEPRLISPMLDGCIIGEAISSHNGVRCCPAIRESTGEKYIVKIISVPASQVQLEAMLLTGACKDRDSALEYFMELAQDILKDKESLASLSRLEGCFAPYEDAQIVPMEDGVGYEVYLLSPYKRSVEKIFANDTLTHLQVVNMGLDLCAALAACRRAGFLFVDLKPGNIFYTEQQDYRIGDLGFVSLNSLQYTTMPSKYQSAYTPKEVLDTMSVLNDTVDTYALGLVLYQAYNGGVLPQLEGADPAAWPSPQYADYEMTEIIQKACALDPKDRWEDPTQMGQALVSYMQRNCINDDPIIPPVLPVEPEVPQEEEAVEEFLPDKEPEPEELAFLQELTQDETAPTEETAENLEDAPVTEETSQMLAQADDLIAHELPEPVVAPEAIEVPIPAPIVIEPEKPEAPEDAQAPVSENADLPAEEEQTHTEETPEQVQEEQEPPVAAAVTADDLSPAEEAPKKKKGVGKTVALLLLLLVLLSTLVLGGWYYYRNFYVQNVESLSVSGTEAMMTVQVCSGIDESKLTVVCTDSYGNTSTSPVTAGVAVFRDLAANTRYTIEVKIEGFHKLTGETSTSFTTSPQTEVLSFTAGIGDQDGAVLLSFTLKGQAAQQWTVSYKADGEQEKKETFQGEKLAITGLTVGKEYTFTLSTQEDIYLIGQTQVKFTASKILFAQDLTITECSGGNLTATWAAPQGETVKSWTVRCYNGSGYDKTVTTNDLTYTFTGLDHGSPCTVEVFAEGMNQSVSTQIEAHAITVTDVTFDTSDPLKLILNWTFTGMASEEGWTITYTTDGFAQEVISCQEASCELVLVPGAKYEITFGAGDVTLFNETASFTCPEPADFEGYALTRANMTFKMCIRPIWDRWNWNNVPYTDYKTEYAAGTNTAFVIQLNNFQLSSQDNIQVLFVLRDSDGTLLHRDTTDIVWDDIWSGFSGGNPMGNLNIPYVPAEAGSYTLHVYFNGQAVAVQNFTIV